MKSFAFLLAAATLLQSTSALPSANGVSVVGEAQHVEERDVHELEKRQTTSSARSRVLWKDRVAAASSSSAAAASSRMMWSKVVTTTTAPRTTTTTSRTTTTTTPRPTSTTTTSSAPASSPTFVAGSDVRDLAISEHNRYRAIHNAGPLTWSQPLADAAYKWGSRCVFEHSRGAVGPYGENLAATAGYKSDILSGAIKPWMDEAPDYTPDNPNYSHFTQVVWKSTTQLGCALVTCPGGTIFDAKYGPSSFYVCEYNPPGNVYPADNFRANVDP